MLENLKLIDHCSMRETFPHTHTHTTSAFAFMVTIGNKNILLHHSVKLHLKVPFNHLYQMSC